ncbi:MAG: hypothetical protein DCC55_15460 [Chloroflexi bacterium]|nr:MAG: hypothetical protein DCC55_15460 [Chloroflexota bacterium]
MRPPKERETAITQSSEDHSRWEVWTDDPYWQRRLDRIAIGRPNGSGKAYTLQADQVLLRQGRRQLSATERERRARNLKRGPETPGVIGSFDTSNASLVCLDVETVNGGRP